MPDISSCYFCSSLRGASEYSIIPPRLDPSDEAQQTVVVCESCREKLDRVFKPIVQYLGTLDTNEKPQGTSSAEEPVDPSQSADTAEQPKSREAEAGTFPDGTRQIVRLLQNRELPADREEIELLASNAYEIDRDTCHEILEALIEHEYFSETNGKIHLPDE